MTYSRNICITGAGSIGTALGQALVIHDHLNVTLLSIENDVVDDINNYHINKTYFPQIHLDKRLKATVDESVLEKADFIFLAIPSSTIISYIQKVKSRINPKAIIVNLAKGFASNNETIVDDLKSIINNPVCSLKGPTFARELINDMPTAMTVGAEDYSIFIKLREIFKSTVIHTDYSSDVMGVELLSILKNIYAITIGIVDAHFNSPNLRFLIFTRAFNEMLQILLLFGGKQETIFRYCGIGDFGLTSLNDLSRNRTLGLLIGKGFFSEDISGKVVLEGRIAVDIIIKKLQLLNADCEQFLLLYELNKVFNGNYDVKKFISNILNNEPRIQV
ncbi:MAG TPA: NAD(P)H-dependent glycerol-3-phosphate dehydrogenase [Lentimicrobium sp.]|nr:NAD(P)H-dependent glycerol-3-phosphate dehydrogenase [Lentimicrobium sp.]